MKGTTVGALCVAACLWTIIEARRSRRARQALGAIALERVERVFDAVENVFHAA